MVEKLLQANNYPRSDLSNIRTTAGNNIWTCSRFPYIIGLSLRTGSLFRHTNCKLVFYNLFKVKNLYSEVKDKLRRMTNRVWYI
ncbi:Protein of unknown function [Cotesia congregata]|uniref:Uncharacterized protein n=1 Tax=Cotesia congregata TaxID=51543 RepID=A0A8J2HIZ4_COTCN|nr:Protein of unknown function [Cotesia congregata]